MPEHMFNNTHAKVADFLFQNPDNFRFTTSIENDSLTLSFCSTFLSPPFNLLQLDTCSPSYLPIQWEGLSATGEEEGIPELADREGTFKKN